MPRFQSQQLRLSNLIRTPIQTGFQVRGKAQTVPQGNYSLIQIKDAIRSVLSYIKSEKLDKISIPEQKRKFMNKYLIQKNDVLYLSKLKPGAFRWTGSIQNILPMAHFYILRPKTDIIDPDYLCWALNQNFMKPQIQSGLRGTALPFISKDALINLKIPLPSAAVQKQITNLLHLRKREKEIQETMDRKKNVLMNTILNGLL